MLRISGGIALLAALCATPSWAQPEPVGPGGRCILELYPGEATRTSAQQQPSGTYNVFQGGGVRYGCQGQDITLDADSAEYYGDAATLYLIGDVRYEEARVSVDADRMTYFQNEDRLLMEGNVDARDPVGSTMTGPFAEYFRARPGERPQRLIATGRPTLVLVQADSLGQPSPPVNVVGDRITTVGDSLVYAGGTVRTTRPDLITESDSAFLDSGREFARLTGDPSIRGTGERPFILSGQIIDLFTSDRLLERVLSTTGARVISEDVEVRADSLDLRFSENELEEAFAWGESRSTVASPGRTIAADSLRILMPGQQLLQVVAIGDAFAETMPDTAVIRSAQRDWLRGDTIIANFDSAAAEGAPAQDAAIAPADSASDEPNAVIRELVAVGNARSFYQLSSGDGDPVRPAVNYVTGRHIMIDFEDGTVNTVSVVGQASGVYLELEADSARAAAAGPTAQPGAPPP